MRRYYEAGQRTKILLDVDVPPGGVVLDVGAFEGAGAARYLQYADRPGIRVLCFEPLPDAAEAARRRFEDDPRVEVFAYGLAGRERHEQLSVAGKGSSTFTSDGRSIEILLRDIDAVLEELGINEVTFAKVNIEGGEYELIDRLGETGRLSGLRTLVVQFHEFVPGAHRLRRRARRLLGRTHRCTWSYPWIFERWDRV
jgi:FkbM family methyltransferase